MTAYDVLLLIKNSEKEKFPGSFSCAMCQSEQVVCEGDFDQDINLEEVCVCFYYILICILIAFNILFKESFFQDVDVLQNHGIVWSFVSNLVEICMVLLECC